MNLLYAISRTLWLTALPNNIILRLPFLMFVSFEHQHQQVTLAHHDLSALFVINYTQPIP